MLAGNLPRLSLSVSLRLATTRLGQPNSSDDDGGGGHNEPRAASSASLEPDYGDGGRRGAKLFIKTQPTWPNLDELGNGRDLIVRHYADRRSRVAFWPSGQLRD